MNILNKIIYKYKKEGSYSIFVLILFKIDNFFFYRFNISLTSFFKNDLEDFKFSDLEIEKRFTKIYKNNLWGSDLSISGPGSEIQFAKKYSEQLVKLVSSKDIKSIFDAPCGDFGWMYEAMNICKINYLGGDIVKELVENNKNLYPKYKFVKFDITKDIFPNYHLYHCRDCFFHFSYEDIKKTLKQFTDSQIEYLLVTSHEGFFKNNDITTGGYRFLNLRKKPFFFDKPLLKIRDYKKGNMSRYMYLYKRDQIKKFIKIFN